MIVGIDHVALSCTDISAAIERLSGEGFTPVFVEKSLQNHPAKKPFLTHYSETHAIAYMRAPAGVAIELTCHSSTVASAAEHAGYQVLLGATLKSSTAAEADAVSTFWSRQRQSKLKRAVWAPFDTSVCVEEGADCRIKAVLLETSQLDASVRFWTEGLGFKASASGNVDGRRWSGLKFISPVPAFNLDLVLVEASGAANTSQLDRAGFPCVALLSNNLAADLEKPALKTHPAESFSLSVNGKFLNIALLRGPSGEIVELIEPERKKGVPA